MSRRISAPAFELECAALRKAAQRSRLHQHRADGTFRAHARRGPDVVKLLADNGLRRGEDGPAPDHDVRAASNALLADEFLRYFDGFSIGSNDLTQLTLGLDRDSGLVAGSFDERDAAVKLLLEMAIRACRKQGKYVGICGQVVGPPGFRALADGAGDRQPVAEPGHRRVHLARPGRQGAPRLAPMQQAGLLRCHSFLALRRPLIVLELALGKRDLQLDAPLGRNAGRAGSGV